MAEKTAVDPVYVRSQGREFIILGTGHVMKESVRQVRQQIKELEPDLVAVELDMVRLIAVKKRQKPSLAKALSSKNKAEAMAYLALHSFQQKAGNEMGVKPGKDMLSAIKEAQKRRIPVFLIDRDIRVTMRRAMRHLTLREKYNIVKSLVLGLFGVSKEDIASVMENKDELMIEFKQELPTMYRALVTERDEYMAGMLLFSPPGRVLAVVGAGHVPGIVRHLTRQLTQADA